MIKLDRPPCPDPASLQTDYRSKENKQALVQSTNGKCMYCESKVNHVYSGDVEHIRPKSVFPNLTYSWSNLGYSCAICNQSYKRDSFHQDLIDPFVDDPSEHLFSFGFAILHRKDSQRGFYTVQLLGLNRTELLVRRAESVRELFRIRDTLSRISDASLINLILGQLDFECDGRVEYSFVRRSVVQHIRLEFENVRI